MSQIAFASGSHDFTEERYVLLASMPRDSDSGTTLRGLWVLADQQESTPGAYWVIVIGTWTSGRFKAIKAIPFQGGFSGRPELVSLTPEVPLPRGDVLTLRVYPTADEATPLTGLTVIPEYAMSGAQAR